MKKMLLAALSAVALAMALAGCGQASTFGYDVDEETGATLITAQNASPDSVTTATFEIAEGELLVVSPNLQSGSLVVTLSDPAGEAAIFEEEVDGRVLDAYDVAPGSYTITVSPGKGGTTGECTILAMSQAEFEQQNADLAAELEKNGMDSSAVMADDSQAQSSQV